MFETPAVSEPLSQGDLFNNCPIAAIRFQNSIASVIQFEARVVVLTQSCDLANLKSDRIQVAVVHEVEKIVAAGVVTAAIVRDQVRRHRVYGWYFLPEVLPVNPESIVDLRDVHTVPRTMLNWLTTNGQRTGRLTTPYREHMAQHFATTFARIALPEPFETK